MCNGALALKRFIQICDRADVFMSQEEADDSYKSGYFFLQCYARLAKAAIEENRCLYRLKPKFHYFAHMLRMIRWYRWNPKKFDLFQAEDFMGKIKECVNTCHRSTASSTFIFRYLRFLQHRWQKNR